tara:strand:- start:1108 stop:2244 length:1137 start_codon:yes stop_codon:yes gene_type:complete
MALGTWRVDPVENRKLQESVGANVVGDVKQVGGYKPVKDFFLSYPLDRSSRPKGEDSFLIQAVEYVPPGKGQGLALKTTQELTSAAQQRSRGEALDTNDDGSVKKFDVLDMAGTKLTNVGMDSRMGELKKKTRFYVELPIPKQVNDGNSCIWSGNSMNLFTLAGLNLATGLMKEPGDTLGKVQNVIDALLKGGNFDQLGLGSGEEMQGAIRSSLAGLAVGQFGSVTPNAVMSRGMGKILNSNKELLFDGVNLREFKFDFTFTPRNSKEGEVAMKIIRNLKMAMAPKKGESNSGSSGGVLINSPNLFLLQYLQGGTQHPFLNSFKPCALTSFSVNYTGAGTYATYADGTPVHMKVAMSFKETNPIYEEDYEDQTMGVGF